MTRATTLAVFAGAAGLLAQAAFVVPSPAVRVTDRTAQDVAGVSFSELGVSRVLQYVVVRDGTLLSLGRSGLEGLVLSMVRGGRATPSAIPVDTASTGVANSPYILLTTADVDANGTLTVALVQFLVDRAGGRFDETTTFLRTFLLNRDSIVAQGPPIEIASTDVAQYRRSGPRARWRYYAVDKDAPARRSATRVLMRDINDDGFNDIVIWKRAYEATPVDGPGPDFQLVAASVAVLQFQPSTRDFSAPFEASDIRPPDELWRKTRGIGWPLEP